MALFTYFITLLNFICCKITLTNQTMYSTDVITSKSLIVPPHCFISGFPCAINSCDVGNKFTLLKPLRKMHEYPYDIEKGIELKYIEGKNKRDNNANINDKVYDCIAHPDFSTQALGIALGGILMSSLYKFFA